jgi:hypothetical protein
MWWPYIASLLLGVVGWFATSFAAKPLLDFLNLRSLVLEEMVFTGNVNQMAKGTPAYGAAMESLRRLGAKVLATDVAAPPLLRRYLSIRGYDLTTAGRGLIGLSNSLDVSGRHLQVDRIEKGLRLPRTSSNEFLEATKKEIGRGGS